MGLKTVPKATINQQSSSVHNSPIIKKKGSDSNQAASGIQETSFSKPTLGNVQRQISVVSAAQVPETAPTKWSAAVDDVKKRTTSEWMELAAEGAALIKTGASVPPLVGVAASVGEGFSIAAGVAGAVMGPVQVLNGAMGIADEIRNYSQQKAVTELANTARETLDAKATNAREALENIPNSEIRKKGEDILANRKTRRPQLSGKGPSEGVTPRQQPKSRRSVTTPSDDSLPGNLPGTSTSNANTGISSTSDVPEMSSAEKEFNEASEAHSFARTGYKLINAKAQERTGLKGGIKIASAVGASIGSFASAISGFAACANVFTPTAAAAAASSWAGIPGGIGTAGVALKGLYDNYKDYKALKKPASLKPLTEQPFFTGASPAQQELFKKCDKLIPTKTKVGLSAGLNALGVAGGLATTGVGIAALAGATAGLGLGAVLAGGAAVGVGLGIYKVVSALKERKADKDLLKTYDQDHVKKYLLDRSQDPEVTRFHLAVCEDELRKIEELESQKTAPGANLKEIDKELKAARQFATTLINLARKARKD
ncbi:MAG: hypothetical protein C5B47_07435 [Verrucomicrobia bacterium]|nr:MAG: hypothetical protein C5B47_07435 [Verrucomicrobiota bacterium]